MLKVRANQLKAIFLIGLFSFLSFFFQRKSWVISERGTDARDNGYHFYRYLKDNHPKIKVYYIIDKKSPDYEKVRDDAVRYGSIRNYWVVATAKKLISSHYALCVPGIGSKLFAKCGLAKKFYFLQHGVIPNNIKFLHRENAPMKLFCCGAKPEYEYIKSVYGHPEGVVRYTGLARYDKLHSFTTSNTVLVMPTWRRFLSALSKEEFVRSDYYIRWNGFLNNPRLAVMLRENNLRLIFYPHYEMQKFIQCFKSEDENVIIADFAKYDVQKLLKDAKLLITDYSSVFFDFAYMNKPCIYYQFDKTEFSSQHYNSGYFDYSVNAFGPVVDSSEKLLTELEKSINLNLSFEKKYMERVEGFFELRDTHNCERIYEAIETLE